MSTKTKRSKFLDDEAQHSGDEVSEHDHEGSEHASDSENSADAILASDSEELDKHTDAESDTLSQARDDNDGSMHRELDAARDMMDDDASRLLPPSMLALGRARLGAKQASKPLASSGASAGKASLNGFVRSNTHSSQGPSKMEQIKAKVAQAKGYMKLSAASRANQMDSDSEDTHAQTLEKLHNKHERDELNCESDASMRQSAEADDASVILPPIATKPASKAAPSKPAGAKPKTTKPRAKPDPKRKLAQASTNGSSAAKRAKPSVSRKAAKPIGSPLQDRALNTSTTSNLLGDAIESGSEAEPDSHNALSGEVQSSSGKFASVGSHVTISRKKFLVLYRGKAAPTIVDPKNENKRVYDQSSLRVEHYCTLENTNDKVLHMFVMSHELGPFEISSLALARSIEKRSHEQEQRFKLACECDNKIALQNDVSEQGVRLLIPPVLLTSKISQTRVLKELSKNVTMPESFKVLDRLQGERMFSKELARELEEKQYSMAKLESRYILNAKIVEGLKNFDRDNAVMYEGERLFGKENMRFFLRLFAVCTKAGNEQLMHYALKRQKMETSGGTTNVSAPSSPAH